MLDEWMDSVFLGDINSSHILLSSRKGKDTLPGWSGGKAGWGFWIYVSLLLRLSQCSKSPSLAMFNLGKGIKVGVIMSTQNPTATGNEQKPKISQQDTSTRHQNTKNSTVNYWHMVGVQ